MQEPLEFSVVLSEMEEKVLNLVLVPLFPACLLLKFTLWDDFFRALCIL